MVGDHEAAGAIPVTQTSTALERHRSAERDTILRRSSAEVQLLSVAPTFGTHPAARTLHAPSLTGKELVVHALGCDVGQICVAVWDGTGFQIRLSSVRFAGGVLIACELSRACGPPCGVTAAGSYLAFRHGNSSWVWLSSRALGSGPRSRRCNPCHPDACRRSSAGRALAVCRFLVRSRAVD